VAKSSQKLAQTMDGRRNLRDEDDFQPRSK
jgi:hypothetical protein